MGRCTHACVHMGISRFIPHHVQKVARLSAMQGRTTDIAGHDSLACWYTFVAHLKPEHLMVHPKLTTVNVYNNIWHYIMYRKPL